MGSRQINLLLSIFCINLFVQIHHISAQTYLGNACINTETVSTQFQANLNTILSTASSNINKYGFYNGKAGHGVDQVNAIALCRGDIGIESCRSCVDIASSNLVSTDQCPNQKAAIIWYDICMFRYSDSNIFGIMSLNPAYLLQNTHDASNVTLFSQEQRSFADNLVNQAYKGSYRKFAAGKISYLNNQTIYGFMQCTPDISPADCKSCLNSISTDLSNCCYDRVGASWITPSCSYRYEIYPFINNANTAADTTTTNK